MLVTALMGAGTAKAAPMPASWHAPSWFLRDATCILHREGAQGDNTGNGYFGYAQWLRSTWLRAGGADYVAFQHPGDRRYPFPASPREEIYRMWIVVMRQDHGSFREWGTAGACGLR